MGRMCLTTASLFWFARDSRSLICMGPCLVRRPADSGPTASRSFRSPLACALLDWAPSRLILGAESVADSLLSSKRRSLELRSGLGVRPEEVVQLGEASSGWLVVEGAVWSSPVVSLEPAG
jgi:hypothetical protein